MKKFYSLLSACLLFAGAAKMSAEREVTTITSVGQKVTNLTQIQAGSKLLFKAVTRDGFLYENSNNKLYLGRTVTSSATSAFYLFTAETYEGSSADEASMTLKTFRGFNFPALQKGKQSTVNAESEAVSFKINRGTGENDGDSIYFIVDESTGLMFNGNELVYNDRVFGLYGTFVGWDTPGDNSRYMIYLPETQTSTLYTVTISGVDESGNDVYKGQNKVYELGAGDTLNLPTLAGYSIDFENSTKDGETLTAQNYVVVDKDAEITLTYKRNPPKFKVIEEGQDTTWYFLKIRGNYFCYFDENNNTDGIPTSSKAKTEEDSVAPYLWAFEGNYDDGFTLYNKKSGEGFVLTASNNENASPVNMTSKAEADVSAIKFEYTEKGDAFVLKLQNHDNAYINQYGGTSGKLKFWVNASSANDNGSKFTVVKYDRDSLDRLARKKVLDKYQHAVRAEGYVGGYTAEQTQELKAALAAAREELKNNPKADTTAAFNAYQALLTKEKIAFDPSKTYAFVSAHQRSGELAAVKYALSYGDSIAAGDSLRRVTWSELPADIKDNRAPARYKWKFVDAQEGFNANAHEGRKLYQGDDSIKTVYALENQLLSLNQVPGAETDMYVGDVQAGRKVVIAPKAEALKFFLQPGTNIGVFTILAYRSNGVNADGVETFVRVGLSCDRMETNATHAYANSYNKLDGLAYNGFYLLEVGDVVDHDIKVGVKSIQVVKAIEEGTMFDLTGRKVTKAQKGLFIINGKKTVVK